MNKLGPSAAAALVVSLMSGALCAQQAYPSRPVRMIVPFVPGGGVDLLARTVSPKLGEFLGQPVLVENRAGAGSAVGAELVARSAPDGYTLLFASISLATLPALQGRLPYDPMDLTGVTQLVATSFVMVAYPKLAANSLKDLLALAKAKPGTLNYGSTGIGSSAHLSTELLKLSAGVDLVHVPYKGDAPLNTALMAGEIHTAIIPVITAVALIKSGKLRPLAVTGTRRSSLFPDVPTMSEAALPGYEASSWQGLFAPSKTPREILARIQRDVASALAVPEVRERALAGGAEVVASTPEEFDAKYKSEIARFTRIVRESHIPQQD